MIINGLYLADDIITLIWTVRVSAHFVRNVIDIVVAHYRGYY